MRGGFAPALVTVFDVDCESSFTPLVPNCCIAMTSGVRLASTEGRNPRILGQNISQSSLERIEPRLIMTPMVHRLAKNRLPHLLGAGGADSPVVFMELETRRLERQSAVLEQPPDLDLWLRDQRFVEDSPHPAGQDRIDMSHELDVI